MSKAKVRGQSGVGDRTLLVSGSQPRAGPVKQKQDVKAVMLSPEMHRAGREREKVLGLRSDALFLFQLQPEQLDCGAAHLQHPLSILQPLKATPVFRAPGLSSVAVASVSNYTVVFLGTASGRLLKVRLGAEARRDGEEAGRDGGGGRGPTLAVMSSDLPSTSVHRAFPHLCLPLLL